MEIAFVSEGSLKIKGKQASLLVDPGTKAAADVVLELSGNEKRPMVEGQRLVVTGAGEYEVGGIKISAIGKKGNLVYSLQVDGVDICLSTPAGLTLASEKLKETQVVVVHASSTVDVALITVLAPAVVVLYGEKAGEGAKALGKEVSKTNKFVTTAEKLPAEMEVVVLG